MASHLLQAVTYQCEATINLQHAHLNVAIRWCRAFSVSCSNATSVSTGPVVAMRDHSFAKTTRLVGLRLRNRQLLCIYIYERVMCCIRLTSKLYRALCRGWVYELSFVWELSVSSFMLSVATYLMCYPTATPVLPAISSAAKFGATWPLLLLNTAQKGYFSPSYPNFCREHQAMRHVRWGSDSQKSSNRELLLWVSSRHHGSVKVTA